MKRLLIPFIALLVVAIIAVAGYIGYQSSKAPTTAIQAPPTIAVARGDVEQVVSAPGVLVRTREVTLSFSMSGRIAKMPVRVGDHVKAGDTLAQLDDAELRYALQTAQAQLSSAQASLDAAKQKNDQNPQQLLVTKAALDKAIATLSKAQADYNAVAWRADVLASQQAAVLASATAEYQAALGNFNITAATINDSALRTAAAFLAQAQVALNQAQDKLAAAKLIAPFDGIVLDVQTKAGEAVNANTGVIYLADPKALEARVTIVEEDFPMVQIGQTTELFFDARPENSVSGAVVRIVPLRDPGDSPIYPVFITLDTVPDRLAAGMTVDSSIQIAKKTNVLRLPRSLAKARSDGTAIVQVWTGVRSENRTVKVGLRGDQYVEIQSGLNEGDQVVSR